MEGRRGDFDGSQEARSQGQLMPAKPDVSPSFAPVKQWVDPSTGEVVEGSVAPDGSWEPIEEWAPRRRFGKEFGGSNVDLGSVPGLRSQLRECLLSSEEALAFAAGCCDRYRRYKAARIRSYAAAIKAQPDGGPAAPRKLKAEMLVAELVAREEDAKLAWDMAKLACKTLAEDKGAVQSAIKLLLNQADLDGHAK